MYGISMQHRHFRLKFKLKVCLVSNMCKCRNQRRIWLHSIRSIFFKLLPVPTCQVPVFMSVHHNGLAAPLPYLYNIKQIFILKACKLLHYLFGSSDWYTLSLLLLASAFSTPVRKFSLIFLDLSKRRTTWTLMTIIISVETHLGWDHLDEYQPFYYKWSFSLRLTFMSGPV
jgi:hypothetical protein